jgi:hypothetical protein
MARFSDYLDSDYLPGEVRRSSYGEASPFSVLNYELGKRLRFKPQSDIAGKYMSEFSNLYSNPKFLANSSMQLPSDFLGFLQASQSAR